MSNRPRPDSASVAACCGYGSRSPRLSGHLDAEGVADDVHQQPEVPAGDPAMGGGVGRQLRVDELRRVHTACKAVFERNPAPTLSFVREKVTLERPYGGKMVLRRQLEHLLEASKLRNVTLQVMPTDREEHAEAAGLVKELKFADGTAIGRSDGAFDGRPVSDPKDLRILELRYGLIRAQALTPRESQAFVE